MVRVHPRLQSQFHSKQKGITNNSTETMVLKGQNGDHFYQTKFDLEKYVKKKIENPKLIVNLKPLHHGNRLQQGDTENHSSKLGNFECLNKIRMFALKK